MQTQAISVKQLREGFPQVRRGLSEGRRYLLIYRSRPIAEIKPIGPNHSAEKFLSALLSPPKELLINTDISSVDLIRQERD